METEKVSIVIPVYNVERYLERCIDSVIQQSYANLQIILVNDGSTDRCPQICNQYAEKDKRIEVIHKKNGGLSEARNYGLEVATGKYITFIDSDDFVHYKYVEYLFSILQQNAADISVCSFQRFSKIEDIEEKCQKDKKISFTGVQALENLCYQKEIKNSACAKLYKMELFKEVYYPVGRLYEDLATTYKLLYRANKVVWSNKEYYYYFYRPGSIMNAKFSEKNLDRIENSKELLDFVEKKIPLINEAAKTRFFVSNIQVLRELPLKEEKYKEIICEVKENIKKYRRCVIKNKSAKLIIRIIALFSYIPLEWLQNLGTTYKKVFKD